ncbi:ankyrin repeat-containing domain protein, partial [Corynascus similis CBS 632.67]
IARLLLERGAVVHTRGGLYGSAWHAATVRKGRRWGGLMQIMLDRGINIDDAGGRQHATALEAALCELEWDPQDVMDRVRFLLERGANVNLQAGRFGSALHSASWRLNHSVQLLVDSPDVDLNAQGGGFGTALQAACSAGGCFAVEQLLRKEANVNLRGGKYGSALNAAVIKGYWYIVELLLEAGAAPDCRLQPEPDKKWLTHICEADSQWAVERYHVFWKKQKEKMERNDS